MTRPSNILCLPTENAGNGGLLVADRPSMDELQRRYLQFILEETGWNRRRTAAVLNLDRRTVQRLIARYQLRSAAAGSYPEM